jgi:hypothetical protein
VQRRGVVAVWRVGVGAGGQEGRDGFRYVDLGQETYPVELVLGPRVAGNPFAEGEVKELTAAVRKFRCRYTPK